MIKKYKRSILILSMSVLAYSIPLIFSNDYWNQHRIDIYLLSDHMRYPENIAYDIAELIVINLLTYCIYSLHPYEKYRRYVKSFLITSLLSFPAYFLIYSQGSTLISIPLLITLLIVAHKKNKRDE